MEQAEETPLFKKHYPALDLLRAGAIILVLLFHFNEMAIKLPDHSYLGRLANWGYNGVDLFFVLSGFLIGGQLIEAIHTGTFSFKIFYIKRFWRIFPAYYTAILITVIYFSIQGQNFILKDALVRGDVIIHLLYLQDYIRPIMYGGLYWSLAVEEQFYLIIPVLLFLILRTSKKGLAWVLLLFIISALLFKLNTYDATKDWWLSYYAPFHWRFDSLLFGVLAAVVFISYRDRLKGKNALKYNLLLGLTAVAGIGPSFIFGGFGAGYFNSCWQFFFADMGFAAVILSTTLSIGSRLPFQKVIGLIAKYSYAMYLYHMLILIPFVFIASKFRIPAPLWLNFIVFFFIFFALVFTFAALHFFLIEGPCLRYRKKILTRRRYARALAAGN